MSQKYKSSADLVSELLKKPVFTRYRSIKKKSNCYISNPCEIVSSHTNSSVISSQHNERGKTIHGVHGVHHGVQEHPPGDHADFVQLQTVQMRLPVTMKPRLATVEAGSVSGSDSDEADHANNSDNQLPVFEVKQSQVLTTTNPVTGHNSINKTNISDKSTSTSTVRLTFNSNKIIDLSL